jgi:hypothetical protein
MYIVCLITREKTWQHMEDSSHIQVFVEATFIAPSCCKRLFFDVLSGIMCYWCQ